MKPGKRIIKRVLMAIALMSAGVVVQGYGETNYSVRGRISLSKTGYLYIYLVDKKNSNKPCFGIQARCIQIDEKIVKKGWMNFDFCSVPEGVYGVRAFLDVNGNRKLDRGILGPTEPWGMSWSKPYKGGWPKFEKWSFSVVKDIVLKNIEVK